MRRKVRFVEPMSQAYSVYGQYIRRLPLMGSLLLGTILEQRGHDVMIYNENIIGSLLDNPKAMADICDADYVGISIMTPSARRGYRIASAIRAQSSKPRIVMGGVHATFCPEEALQYADLVVTGEGENVIAEIVENNVAPGIIHGSPVENMDSLPLPNFELIHGFDQVWSEKGYKELYSFPISTSRGCPYNCRFCSVTRLFGHRYRKQSPEKVIRDIRALHARGHRHFLFYDDNFTADRARVRQILDGVRDLGIAWDAQTRIDFHWLDPKLRKQCDTSLLHAMRQAGGDMLLIGYETIEDETARKWNKGYVGAGDLEKRSSADTRILHDAGFWIHGMFVIGPEHGERSLERIVRFATRNRLESIQISALTPFPGTVLFEEVKDKLFFRSFPDDWELYDGMHIVLADTKAAIKRFQEKVMQAHWNFYRHLGPAFNRVTKLFRGPGNLFLKARHLWTNITTPIRVRRAWERETQQFLRRLASLDPRHLWKSEPTLGMLEPQSVIAEKGSEP